MMEAYWAEHSQLSKISKTNKHNNTCMKTKLWTRMINKPFNTGRSNLLTAADFSTISSNPFDVHQRYNIPIHLCRLPTSVLRTTTMMSPSALCAMPTEPRTSRTRPASMKTQKTHCSGSFSRRLRRSGNNWKMVSWGCCVRQKMGMLRKVDSQGALRV